MEPYRLKHDRRGRPRLEVPYRGQRLLRHPMYSKGTAFTREERAALDAAAHAARASRRLWLPPHYRWLDGRWSS